MTILVEQGEEVEMFPAAAEGTLRGAMNRAIRDGLFIVEGAKEVRKAGRLVGVCPLGALALDGRAIALPDGAIGALVDGFDGRRFDRDMDAGLGAWHELGLRLRKAYKPRRLS